MPGIKLSQPPPAARNVCSSYATAATSGGVNSIVFRLGARCSPAHS